MFGSDVKNLLLSVYSLNGLLSVVDVIIFKFYFLLDVCFTNCYFISVLFSKLSNKYNYLLSFMFF